MLGAAALLDGKEERHQRLGDRVVDTIDGAISVTHAGLRHGRLGRLELALLLEDEAASLGR